MIALPISALNPQSNNIRTIAQVGGIEKIVDIILVPHGVPNPYKVFDIVVAIPYATLLRDPIVVAKSVVVDGVQGTLVAVDVGSKTDYYVLPTKRSSASSSSRTVIEADEPFQISVKAANSIIGGISTSLSESNGGFQEIRFYDGAYLGYLRVFSDRASLILGEGHSIDFSIDGTRMHVYRLIGKGKNIKLYIDGQLAIDASEKLISKTNVKQLEFGSLSSCNGASSGTWDFIRYTTKGDFPPATSSDLEAKEVLSFPNKSISAMRRYGNNLYFSVDSPDGHASSELYKYSNSSIITPTISPLTGSYVSSVVVDPNRNGNIFGNTGKYIGTNRGLQYVLGSKAFPFDVSSYFSDLPDSLVWTADENCKDICSSANGEYTAIDTSSELGTRFCKYIQDTGSDWDSFANNKTGWTVEAVVKVVNDGSGGTVNATVSNLVSSNCQAVTDLKTEIPEDDGLNAPGIYINDGRFQEIVQLFQNGIRLKYANIFSQQSMNDQFYTVRIIGRLNAIAVFVKGENEVAFKKVIFEPNGMTVLASMPRDAESIHSCTDDLGNVHTVWQQADDNFHIYYNTFSKTKIVSGNGMRAYLPTLEKCVSVLSVDFLKSGVATGDDLVIYLTGGAKRYIIDRAIDKNTLSLTTSDDLSTLAASDFAVFSGPRKWGRSIRISDGAFDAGNPRIIHHRGNLFVTYDSNQFGHQEVFIRRAETSFDGVKWRDILRVTNSSKNSRRPDVAAIDVTYVENAASNDFTILAVFESENSDGTCDIAATKIDVQSFGAKRPTISLIHGDNAHDFNPRVAIVGTKCIVVFESDSSEDGISNIFASVVNLTNLSGSTYAITTNNKCFCPSLITFIDKTGSYHFATAWVDKTIRSEIYFATSDDGSSWNSHSVTDSVGRSDKPVLAMTNNFIVIAFESDRVREGMFDPYIVRAKIGNTGIDEVISSAGGWIDTRILTNVSDSRNISISPDINDICMFWQTTVDGVMNVVGIGTSLHEKSNLNISAYFPLNEHVANGNVKNAIRDILPDNTIADTVFATASENTINISIGNSSLTKALPATLYPRESDSAFDLNSNGRNFVVPASLIPRSGAIDIRVRPHWHSSSLSEHVFFGSGSGATNSIYCGVGSETSGNSLRLRLVDSAGTLHETKISGIPLSLWAEDDDVHIRAVWDAKAIGIARINEMYFLPNNYGYGWACGNNGNIFRTINWGTNWIQKITHLTYDIYSIFFSGVHGVACGEAGTILYSSDSGDTWNLAEYPDMSEDLKSIVMSDDGSTAYAVGTGGTILISSDYGATWISDPLAPIVTEDFNAIGKMLLPSTANVFSVFGQYGSIYTKTGTESWTLVTTISTVWKNASKRSLAGNEMCACGEDGKVIRSTNGGVTWIDVSPPFINSARPIFKTIDIGAPNQIWVVTSGSIGRSNDGGSTWSFLDTRPDAVTTINAFSNRVMTSGSGGFFMASTDGAATQTFNIISSKNLTLLVNGVELDQIRTNDSTFDWTPSQVFFGDYRSSGNATANAIFDEVVIYSSPPPRESTTGKYEVRYIKADAKLAISNVLAKKIEWGNISPFAKGKTHWKSFKMFFCGSKEPIQTFCWDSRVGLSDDVVNDLTIDNEGMLWIATGHGISKLDTTKASEAIERWLDGDPQLPTIKSRYITRYTDLYDGYPCPEVLSISSNTDGVWAVSKASLFRLRPKEDSSSDDPATQANIVLPKPIDDGVFEIVENFTNMSLLGIEAVGNFIYICSTSGLQIRRVDPAEIVVIPTLTMFDGLPSNRVQAVAKSNDGDLWIGTDRGFVRVSQTLSVFGQRSGLVGSNIYSVIIDSKGRKILGTNFGVAIFDGSDFEIIAPSQGVGSAPLTDCTEDSGKTLWFASALGLIEVDQACKKYMRIDMSDGIIGEPRIKDFKIFKMIGMPNLSSGCNHPMAIVYVNGVLNNNFTMDYNRNWVVFNNPLTPSDDVAISIYRGVRKISGLFGDKQAFVTTEGKKYNLYSKSFVGMVTLGGAAAVGSTKNEPFNYAVFVVPFTTNSAPISSISAPSDAEIVTAEIGVSFYSDITNEITALPAEITSSKMISVFNADSNDVSDSYLIFDLATASTVYVAFDSSATAIPNWLREFEQVSGATRISSMKTFTDASGDEKLFIGTKGSNGCVYSALDNPSICDISASISLDAEPPIGCAVIAAVNSRSSVLLSIDATDGVTGVTEMQISARPDFMDDDDNASPWITYQPIYNFELPLSAILTTTDLATIPDGTATCTIEYQGLTLVGTSSPGLVYSYSKATATFSLLITTGESKIHAFSEFNGDLIIGTGTNGKVFKWNKTFGLSQFSTSIGTDITALFTYNNNLYIGSAPGGEVWVVEKSTATPQLFKNTNETAITAFCSQVSILYWSTKNETIADNDVLSTTTTSGHKHTVSVTSDGTLSTLNSSTSEVDGHYHDIVNGVVQSANGHTHVLNGSASGKVFSYDITTGQIKIVHLDTDYNVSAIGATATAIYAGTTPNGKILRKLADTDLFIKSFQTPKHSVAYLGLVGSKFLAVVDDDLYQLENSWSFRASVETEAVGVVPDSVQGELLILKPTSIVTTANAPSQDNKICAYIRFKDAAGNITDPKDADGKFITCYNPCINLTGGGGGLNIGSNRIFEINDNGKVLLSLNGSSEFYSGTKIEEEVATYYSEVFNGTTSLVQWESIQWDSTLPTGTEITISVRTSSTSSGINSAFFTKEFADNSRNDISSLQGQFLQFKATLRATVAGAVSPSLNSVLIKLRTSQAVHFYTTNFVLPDNLRKAILTYNGCINPPSTDIIFGINGQDATDFGDYYVIPTNKVFEVPTEHQTKNMRIGIKFISSPTEVPVVDEFAILLSLANDTLVKLNIAGSPTETQKELSQLTSIRTVTTDRVQNHAHAVSYDSLIIDKAAINVSTSINAGHFHEVINGVVQIAAGHTHSFDI